MNPRTLLGLALAALACRADGLSDLKAALGRTRGQEAARATLEHQSWSQSTEGKKTETTQGKAGAQLEDGPGGLRLAWNRGTLQQAHQESRAHSLDPEKQTPTWSAIGEVSVKEVSDWANGGEALLRKLDEVQAQLQEEKPDAYQGKPARLLLIKATPRFRAEDKKDVKSHQTTLRIWVGADGLPVACAAQTQIKASKFFITVTASKSEEIRFARLRDRLVATYICTEESNSVMGMTQQAKQVTNLTWN